MYGAGAALSAGAASGPAEISGAGAALSAGAATGSAECQCEYEGMDPKQKKAAVRKDKAEAKKVAKAKAKATQALEKALAQARDAGVPTITKIVE